MQTLVKEQRDHWESEGYLLLKQVLGPKEVALFSSEIDRLRCIAEFEPVRDKNLSIEHDGWLAHANNLDDGTWMDRRGLFPFGKRFVNLMDRPYVFDLIVDIM